MLGASAFLGRRSTKLFCKIVFLSFLILFFLGPNLSEAAAPGGVVVIDGINIYATITGSISGDSGTGYVYAAIDTETRQKMSEKIGSIQPFYWNNDPGLYELMTGAAVESFTDFLRSVSVQTKSTNSPLVIISHSWGTVLAYIVLHKNPDIVVDKLITMGSPLEAITPIVKDYTNLTLMRHGSFPVVTLPNIKTWHNYWTLCDLISSTIGAAMNHQSDVSFLDSGSCHSGYYKNPAEWESILTDVLNTQHPLATKFQKAYLGDDVMGSPVNDIHDWGGYWVQDYPDMPGFGRSIMIYNPSKDKVYIVHGDIWAQVYEAMGGVNSWLGLPTSNEYSFPVADSLNNVRQDFEHGFITHASGSNPWWRAYSNDSQPSAPTIAQTDTGEYPPQFSRGQTFRQWGTGFTPNNYATLHFRKPDGSEYPTLSQPLDSLGHFDISYTPPLNMPAGTYTWWAIDNSTGNISNVISYKIVSSSTPTRTINVISPNGGQRLREGDDYWITWQTTGTIDKVRIDLYKKDNRIKILTTDLDRNGTLNDGNFEWHISGFDDYSESYRIKLIACNFNEDCVGNADVEDFSDYFFTIIRKPPSKVSGPNISNGATNQSIESVISWSKVDDATSYDVYFGTDPDSLDYKGNQTFRTFDPGTLTYCTTYYWRIDSRNEGGVTTGNVWSFKAEIGLFISGRVVDENTGQPIAGKSIYADYYYWDYEGYHWGYSKSATTDNNGYYEICGLEPDNNYGSYSVEAIGRPNYTRDYYRDVDVNSTDVNFNLVLAGFISGQVVKEDTGFPIANIIVTACSQAWYCENAATDFWGNYTITGLFPAVGYRVDAYDYDHLYAQEFYDNTWWYDMATPVTVTSGVTTEGINFNLAVGGSISGKVIADDTGQPIAGIWVDAEAVQGGGWSNAMTDVNGNYTISGLQPINHSVKAGSGYYVKEFYDNTYDGNNITPVNVQLGLETGGIDFSLAGTGSISGKVIDADTGQPIAGINVFVNEFYGEATTDLNGNYLKWGMHIMTPDT